ncbi:hypothetical protein D3C78_514670 [compost metagenome]
MRKFVELDVQHFLEQLAHHLLGDLDDVAFFQEAGLDVDLGEFRLAVGTQVFVAEALGDLVVAIEAGDHQQLLEQLGRLRQGEEVARVGTARHQVVARAFRSRATEDRGFHIEETVVVQVAADAAGDARAQLQLGGHFRAAQVDEAVAQAGFLAHIGVLVQRERRSFRLVQHFQFVTQHLDGAGSHVGVTRAFGAHPHLAGDLDDVLAAHAVSLGEGLCTIRIEHDLGQAFAITHVEEDHPAMVATAVHPAAKSDFLAVQALVQLAAIMAAHHGVFASRKSWILWNRSIAGSTGASTATGGRTGRSSFGGRQVLLRTGLEVGLVPAATTQAEAGGRKHLLQFGSIAGRAIDQRGVAELLDLLQMVIAGSALVFVYRHRDTLAVTAPRARTRRQRRGL